MTESKVSDKNEIKKHIAVFKGKVDKYLPSGLSADVLILRAHLICEYYLNQILILKHKVDAKKIDELRFFEKLDLAFDKSDTYEKNIFDRVNKLNKLRNRVGHELEYVLSEYDVDLIGFYNGEKYIAKKYDLSNDLNILLRDVLLEIIIDLSVVILTGITEYKKKA